MRKSLSVPVRWLSGLEFSLCEEQLELTIEPISNANKQPRSLRHIREWCGIEQWNGSDRSMISDQLKRNISDRQGRCSFGYRAIANSSKSVSPTIASASHRETITRSSWHPSNSFYTISLKTAIMTAISSSSLLAVTITLIVLTICGEMQTATGATVQQYEEPTSNELAAPRTFGRIRMMKNFLIPLMFVMGAIKMLLLFLTAISVKTFFVAVVILVINISVGLATVINFFKNSKHGHHHETWSGPEKNVNIHIHSDPTHQLSLDGPHSSISPSSFPYARNDAGDSIYSVSSHSLYPKTYTQGTAKTLIHPYSNWQHYARTR
ncbi:uncharacterized protein LOC131691323 [Topomyia yanbarensis]|uniref:uncharacterized protein LOC131691323 n=1 Tax=Topomyia yanbarensis TaxID=2498891 RepID=UPI00273B67B4|nr:uncharacterized protein LOC131691323 [Topomyia yanbarensis]